MNNILNRINELRQSNFGSSNNNGTREFSYSQESYSTNFCPKKNEWIPEIFLDKVTNTSFSSNAGHYSYHSNPGCNPMCDKNEHYFGKMEFGPNVRLSVECRVNQCYPIVISLEKQKINMRTKQIYWKLYSIDYNVQICEGKIIVTIGKNILKLLQRFKMEIENFHIDLISLLVHNFVSVTRKECIINCMNICDKIDLLRSDDYINFDGQCIRFVIDH